MKIETYSTTNVECPNCGADFFDEEACQDLCFEPFNGTNETCDSCEAELFLEMRVQVSCTD